MSCCLLCNQKPSDNASLAMMNLPTNNGGYTICRICFLGGKSLASKEGILFVLSGPTGVGKGTVRRKLFKRKTDLKYSVSMTTRKKRPAERVGVDYFFKTKQEFERLIHENKLLEYAQYVDNYYGTPREYVED